MTPVDLRALREAATKGPWRVADDARGNTTIIEARPGGRHLVIGHAIGGWLPEASVPEADAALIVAAVNSLPHLLDHRDLAREALQQAALYADEMDSYAAEKIRAALSVLDEQEPPRGKTSQEAWGTDENGVVGHGYGDFLDEQEPR